MNRRDYLKTVGLGTVPFAGVSVGQTSDVEVLIAETQGLADATKKYDDEPLPYAKKWIETAIANANIRVTVRIKPEPVNVPDTANTLAYWDDWVADNPTTRATDANLLITAKHAQDAGGRAECACQRGNAAISHWGDRLAYGQEGTPYADEVSWLQSAHAKSLAVHEVGHLLGLEHSMGNGYRHTGAFLPDESVVSTPMLGLYLLTNVGDSTPDITAEEIQNNTERLFLRSTFSEESRTYLQQNYA